MNPGLAIVTGASSGIGAATARSLAGRGWDLVLVARRAGRLAQLAGEIHAAGGGAQIFPADLSDPDGRQALFAAHPSADLLVNNAGLGWYGYAEKMNWDVTREMIAVNIAACVQLCQLYLPGMRARRRGHIINVGSIAGGMPNQGIALYAASKAFLDAFTTAVYRELRGSGVEISIVRPGPVKSEFFESARQRDQGGSIPGGRLAVQPATVADCILGLVDRPRRAAYVPWYMRFSPLLETGFGWLIDRLGPLLLRRDFSNHPSGEELMQ